ncbi:MAG: radical SAM protein [Sphingomonadales bacterium]|nr:radical SAM protein [Sphingomonadales bacterium]
MEQFYTIQGEGHYAGTAAYFIRLGGCDVGCVWCDVKESWDAEAHPLIAVETLVETAAASDAPCCVITGGEPAMYDLTTLTLALKQKGLRVHIETSAAHPIRGQFDWICISPKKFKFPLETEMEKAHELKIIVFNKSDFEWAEKWAQEVAPDCLCMLQPEWDKRDDIMPLIVDYVKSNPRWKISLQTHKYLGVP